MAHYQTPHAEKLLEAARLKIEKDKLSIVSVAKRSGIDAGNLWRMINSRCKTNFTYETGVQLMAALEIDYRDLQ